MDTTGKLLLGGGVALGLYLLLRGDGAAGSIIMPTEERRRIMAFGDVIWGAGAVHNVDPAIIAAIIDVESDGDPNAIGGDGEVGLMQVLPGTSDWMKCNLTVGQLQDPINNTRCGAKYMRYCLDYFDGNIAAALCAYNAGPRNVFVDTSRGGLIVANSKVKKYSAAVMHRVPAYREEFRRFKPTYYGLMFRPDQWWLNMNDFD